MKENWLSSEGGSPLRFTHKGLGGRLLKASAFSLAKTQPIFLSSEHLVLLRYDG